MPVIELDIGGTPRRVQVDDGFQPADLDHIASTLAGSAETAVSEKPSAISRAASYITRRGREIGGALGRVTGFGEEMGVTGPGSPMPEVSPGQAAADVATIAGPMIAPGLSAAGTAVGAGARALDADEGTAGLLDIGTQVAGGLGGAIKGGFQGARGAKNIIPEGERLREMVPALRQAVSGERGKLFDPVIGYLKGSGRTLKIGTPEGDKLGQSLLDAAEDWGGNRAINMILEKLTKGGAVGAEEVDQALAVVNQMGKSFATRRALTSAMDDLARGTPAEGRMSAAAKEYFKVIKPAQRMATAVGKQDTPGGAALTAIREWNKLSPKSQALLDPTGEVAELVKSAKKGARGAAALAGGIGAAGAVAYGTQRILQGDVKGGLMAFLGGVPLMALRMPGVVGAAARGAAPGVGRGIAGGAGVAAPMLGGDVSQETTPTPQNAQEAPGEPQEAPPVSSPSPTAQAPQGPFGREMEAVASAVGIPAQLMRVIRARENPGNDPNIVSGDPSGPGGGGAVGLMQLMPDTFAHLRPRILAITGRREANINDPIDNLVAGALHLRDDLDATGGDVEAMARRYHGGPNQAMHGPRTREYGSAIARNFGSQ